MEASFLGLEQCIESLINECRRLTRENHSLKSDNQVMVAEKTQLQEKNKIACTRLEKIVEKLRTLEDQ